MPLLTTYRIWHLITLLNEQCINDREILLTENSSVSSLNSLVEFEYKFLRFFQIIKFALYIQNIRSSIFAITLFLGWNKYKLCKQCVFYDFLDSYTYLVSWGFVKLACHWHNPVSNESTPKCVNVFKSFQTRNLI